MSASNSLDLKGRQRPIRIETLESFGVAYLYANLLGNEAGRVIYDGGGLIASGGELLVRKRQRNVVRNPRGEDDIPLAVRGRSIGREPDASHRLIFDANRDPEKRSIAELRRHPGEGAAWPEFDELHARNALSRRFM